MESMLLYALLGTPLVASILAAAVPANASTRIIYEILHTVVILASAIIASMVVVQVFQTGPVSALGGWLYVDSLGIVFVGLIGIIGLLTGLYSLPYIRHELVERKIDPRRVRTYYAFFSLFMFTMFLAATSNNIIMMWVAIEATTLSTVFLVGLYEQKLSLEAAWKYVIVCTVGVAFGLYGTILLYTNAADVMADPEQAIFWTSIMQNLDLLDPRLVAISFAFAVVGFGTKAGLFPMHTWLPDAHSEAPSPVSALLSGVLLKCAMLVVIRFYIITTQVVGDTLPRTVMLIIGAASVIYAAIALFSQNDIKRKLAYSSCENVGIIALCLGFGGPIGIAAALLHTIFHGITKALLFCLSGNLLMQYDTRDLTRIKGVLRAAPVTGTLLIIGLFAVSGFPPFALFISEIAMFMAGFEAGLVWLLVIIALALTVVMAAFSLVATRSILPSGDDEHLKDREVKASVFLPEVALALVILWFGVALPSPIIQTVQDATVVVLQLEEPAPIDLPSILPEVDTAGRSDAIYLSEK